MDLADPMLNKVKCSHECVDGHEGNNYFRILRIKLDCGQIYVQLKFATNVPKHNYSYK